MFLIVAIFGGVYYLFRLHKDEEPIGWHRLLGTIFITGYTVFYMYIPPHLDINSPYLAKLYELIPILCYIGTMVPEASGASYEEKVSAFFSWFGLLFITIVLAYFKFYVW